MAELEQFELLLGSWHSHISLCEDALSSRIAEPRRISRLLENGQRIQEQQILAAPYRGGAALQNLHDGLTERLHRAEDTGVTGHITPAHLDTTGGRPRVAINADWLQDAVNVRRLSLEAIRELLPIPVSTRTLQRNIVPHGVRPAGTPSRPRTDISDTLLRQRIAAYLEVDASAGSRFAWAYLKSSGIFVPRARVRTQLRVLRPIHTQLRENNTVRRRVYESEGPNHMWQNDGCHHLIAYGIVSHGFIDGYSRLVVGLRDSTNNTADTVLQLFKMAAGTYGVPVRCRGDRGGENLEVAKHLAAHWNDANASTYQGLTVKRKVPLTLCVIFRSVHNTRIERLWGDLRRVTQR